MRKELSLLFHCLHSFFTTFTILLPSNKFCVVKWVRSNFLCPLILEHNETFFHSFTSFLLFLLTGVKAFLPGRTQLSYRQCSIDFPADYSTAHKRKELNVIFSPRIRARTHKCNIDSLSAEIYKIIDIENFFSILTYHAVFALVYEHCRPLFTTR